MSGKKILLWMRSKCESRKQATPERPTGWRLDALLDEAREDGVLGVSAAEEALRAVSGGRVLGACGLDVVVAAIKRGSQSAPDVAAANGIPLEVARRQLGF